MRRRTRRLLTALLALTLLGLSAACATGQGAEGQVEQSVDDKIYDYRTVLRQLRAHPQAEEAGRELDLVEVWLGRVERLQADEEDEELVELYLEAIEGQLVQVRSYYARREAELDLERARASYEARAQKIQVQRERNVEQLEPIERREGQ